jgi:peptide-methionine (S)-S-oxide reductase
MKYAGIASLVMLTLLTGCAGEASSKSEKPAAKPAAASTSASAAAQNAKLETAIFAGGCFWCVETQFEGVPGVKSVISGFTGGHVANPSYEQVGAGGTGHYESVEIRFDPAQVKYADLLDMFWHSIDPTQANGQFCDRGPTYRSAIFWKDSTQLRAAESSKRAIEKSGVLKAPIVTQILPAAPFYAAEEYHQDFWRKDPDRYYNYREGCGRDARLAQVWGKKAAKPTVH